MTVIEGVVLGLGAVALGVGGYVLLTSMQEAAAQDRAALEAQNRALIEQASARQVPTNTGNSAVNTGLALFQAVGGVEGLSNFIREVRGG